jgi:hypothetical protein
VFVYVLLCIHKMQNKHTVHIEIYFISLFVCTVLVVSQHTRVVMKRKKPKLEPHSNAGAGDGGGESCGSATRSSAKFAAIAAVETTHTRELYFGYKCMNKATLEKYNKSAQDIRAAVDSDVRALAICTRNGTRFLELHLRMLLSGTATQKLPENFNFPLASRQAMAAMQETSRPYKVNAGYAEALQVWKQLPENEHFKGVKLQAYNSLTYTSNAYYSTLLCNYTKVALPTHAFWTLRYLYPAKDTYTVLKAVLMHRNLPNSDLRAAPHFIADEHYAFITAAFNIADAEYTNALAIHALELRWAMLRAIDAKEATGVVETYVNRSGETVQVRPKRFHLVPQCSKAAPFVTLDSQWAQNVLGVPPAKKTKALLRETHVDTAKTEVEVDKNNDGDYEPPQKRQTIKPEPVVAPKLETQKLESQPPPVSYLEQLFDCRRTRQWGRPYKQQQQVDPDGKPHLIAVQAPEQVFKFPATVKTNGVSLQIPYTRTKHVPITKTNPKPGKKPSKQELDKRRRDPNLLAAAAASPNPHGLFHMEALGDLKGWNGPIIGVDPGVVNLVTTCKGTKITREQFYGKRPIRQVYAQYTVVKPSPGHLYSRHTRRGAIPDNINAAQVVLSEHSLRDCSTNVPEFIDRLRIWLHHSQTLQQFYGTRSQRAVRLTKASKKRAAMSNVVETIAPDPATLVAFGANFHGRPCHKGDVAGPVVVKGIRKALAARRVVLMVDEYRTSMCHHVCGTIMNPDPVDAREKVCPSCLCKVDRDANAARNIGSVVVQYFVDKQRPAHLRRASTALPSAPLLDPPSSVVVVNDCEAAGQSLAGFL